MQWQKHKNHSLFPEHHSTESKKKIKTMSCCAPRCKSDVHYIVLCLVVVAWHVATTDCIQLVLVDIVNELLYCFIVFSFHLTIYMHAIVDYCALIPKKIIISWQPTGEKTRNNKYYNVLPCICTLFAWIVPDFFSDYPQTCADWLPSPACVQRAYLSSHVDRSSSLWSIQLNQPVQIHLLRMPLTENRHLRGKRTFAPSTIMGMGTVVNKFETEMKKISTEARLTQ